MMNTEFRLFLQEEFLRRSRKNARYSIRSYAKTLQIDFSTLAKILKANRPIGPKTIQKLGTRLGLTSSQINMFVQGNQQQRRTKRGSAKALPKPQRNYEQLALDVFQIVSDWHHYALLELMRVDSFKPDPRWIASQLGLRLSEATIAIERLQRAGFIEASSGQEWKDLSSGFSTTLGGPDTTAAFRSLQRQVLEKALTALEETPIEYRDQTSMTMAIDSRLLPEARDRIKTFRRELAEFLSRGSKRDSVYHLGVSLYPVTPVQSLSLKGDRK